jgi:RNA polymerase sigma-70 factor (ECF subfamily)
MKSDKKAPRSLAIEHLSLLIHRVARGDQKAFSDLHALTRDKLRKTARAVCSSNADVEDILQDTYLKIWRHAASFDPGSSSPISWMSTIIRNTAIDSVRSKRFPVTDIEKALSVPMPTDDAVDELHLERVGYIIGRLPEERRTLLSLAYLHGESRAALSERFGVPVGTIKTWLRRTVQAVNREFLAYSESSGVTNAKAWINR